MLCFPTTQFTAGAQHARGAELLLQIPWALQDGGLDAGMKEGRGEAVPAHSHLSHLTASHL
jgi:hypothetical protein